MDALIKQFGILLPPVRVGKAFSAGNNFRFSVFYNSLSVETTASILFAIHTEFIQRQTLYKIG